jgi:hypothetical protein
VAGKKEKTIQTKKIKKKKEKRNIRAKVSGGMQIMQLL